MSKLLMAAAGGAAPEFPDIAGIKFRYDVSSFAGFSDNDPIATMTDSSGQGRNATSAVNQAIYKTNVFGDLPAARFTGDEYLFSAFAQDSINYLYAVVDSTSVNNGFGLVMGRSGNFPTAYFGLPGIGGYDKVPAVYSPTGDDATLPNTPVTRKVIIRWRMNGTTAGVRADSGTESTSTNISASRGNYTGIGLSTQPLSMDIAEIIMYTGNTPTSEEDSQLMGYLSAKWGV
jgi:hypothetical protein